MVAIGPKKTFLHETKVRLTDFLNTEVCVSQKSSEAPELFLFIFLNFYYVRITRYAEIYLFVRDVIYL